MLIIRLSSLPVKVGRFVVKLPLTNIVPHVYTCGDERKSFHSEIVIEIKGIVFYFCATSPPVGKVACIRNI